MRIRLLGIPSLVSVFALTLAAPPLPAAPPPPLKTFEVHADGRITFRYRDAHAAKVALNFEGAGKPLPMVRSEDGVWTATTPPQAPQIYYYSFDADGEPRLDPQNPTQKPNLISFFRGNLVTVPGRTPQPWEPADIPHGTVHHHVYTTKIVTGLPGNQSDYFVYTPPGYDPKASSRYPVLYLLHGWSDLALGWTEVGKANLILDHLIAKGLAQPMIVVMPLSYGEMSFVATWETWDDAAARGRNFSLFERALLQEVMPRAESAYAISRTPTDRAITGLSMGGYESVTIGLNHPELFSWVGGFSAAVQALDYDRDLPATAPKGNALRLLWIACGTGEELIEPNRKLTTWLKQRRFPVTPIETTGAHTYMVWRENLVSFASLLFRK